MSSQQQPAPPVHEYGFTSLKLASHENVAPHSENRFRKGSSLYQGPAFRQGQTLRGWNADELGVKVGQMGTRVSCVECITTTDEYRT
jgi:hypothetical protein